MSVPAIILVMLISPISLQLWTGRAIVGRRFRSEWLNNPDPEQFVHRDDFPQLYWLSIGIQSAVIALVCLGDWWRQ